MLDLPASELLDGRSTWPLVTGTSREIRPRIVTGWGPWTSVRDLRWNCILNPTTADGQPRLFDLLADPSETIDVADQHPGVVESCRQQVEGLIGSPFPVRFKHQPDAGDYMTLGNHFRRRESRAMPIACSTPVTSAPVPIVPFPPSPSLLSNGKRRPDDTDRLSA